MCKQCETAVHEQDFEKLVEIAGHQTTNHWITRCPCCHQLWETYAFAPQVSWEVTLEDVRQRYADFIGNRLDPVTLDPRWLTSTVLDLARTIYDERAFERMPILADALMDAGCDSEEIIKHCQGPGPHVRGCYVVDLLLGKV